MNDDENDDSVDVDVIIMVALGGAELTINSAHYTTLRSPFDLCSSRTYGNPYSS